jgi:hypothetical protein
MKTTLADRIRAVVNAASHVPGFVGLYIVEIAERTGDPVGRVIQGVRRMRKAGFLSRIGHDGRRGVRYGPGREPIKVYAHPPEDAERLRRETHRRCNREYKRRIRAQRPKKPAPSRRPEAQQPKVKARPPYQAREIATAPASEALPDTNAWLAANADRFERLPPGRVSKASALRFDHRRTA